MARKKSNKILSVFTIFFTSIKTYFLYLDKTCRYLLFPIFGQLIGIILIFTCAYYFNINSENLRNNFTFLQNDRNFLLTYFLILLPFFIIFLKAVYDYIIAFCSLNILFYTTSNKKKVKNIDFKANNKVIERKITTYVILLLIITLVLILPPLVLIFPLTWLFLCLSFQVFSFENDINAFEVIARSFELVKNNIIPTIIMLLLCYALTYWFLPNLFIWSFDKISLTYFMINTIDSFVRILPLEPVNNILSIVNYNLDTLTISKYSVETIISIIVIGFTLPFRCCCFTELYKLYDYEKIKDFSKESDEIIKRAAGKKRKN